jgi:1-phosphatidylinositol phosphodiesterase
MAPSLAGLTGGWLSSSQKAPVIFSMAPLTIRNVTSTPFEVKLIERFNAPNNQPDNGPSDDNSTFGKLSSNFTTLVQNVTANVTNQQPTNRQLADNAQSFSHEDVNIRVEPFEVVRTNLQAADSAKEIVRLTIEVDGQRYRVDTPSPSNRSNELTPLSPNPKYEFTAVYLPEHSYVSFFSSARLNSWMGKLRSDSPLSALSIPGTHNSPTCHTALPSVRCQAKSLREQLDNGVRFLDIRVQPENPDDANADGLILVHSAFPISLTGNLGF